MRSACPIRTCLLASVFLFLTLAQSGTVHAASFPEFVDPHPAPGNQFGATVLPLSTGNVVITSPNDDAGGIDAGAVYLFNGATGALISTLTGSSDGDHIGNGGVTALSNGNYVIRSPNWHNGAIENAGAVTFGRGTTGVTGAVSTSNSLVGGSANDQVGSGSVTPLTNGNYVVRSQSWHNGSIPNAGAVTWGRGTSGVFGLVSAANSLVGSTATDLVGDGGVTALSNGNYVVRSSNWDNGAIVDAGGVTWGNGTTGVTGALSPANSLVGSTANDLVGGGNLTALTNGNYVVASPFWSSGGISSRGAVTWGNGASGVTGAVSAANSLVGSSYNDQAGFVTALSNGNYVITTQNWHNGTAVNAGAATWGSGTTGVSGVVSAANSLVGSKTGDLVGQVTPLTNGNYVVRSQSWDNGAIVDAGAATWANGATGLTGTISAANSLVGSSANDLVGNSVAALSNGNYVVCSSSWTNGSIADAGAATWANGTTGLSGTISAANSLVGSTASDFVGSSVAALSNGNYVVMSQSWGDGVMQDVGAVTWGNGTTGVHGAVSPANSLVGSTDSDRVGSVKPLTNGNYVVLSQYWSDGANTYAGAATWGSGTTGVTGVVSAANSLVGSSYYDQVGVTLAPLANGNYVVQSYVWKNGGVGYAGAATWGNGTSGVSGVVSPANSLVGSTYYDQVGSQLTALSNGDYVVRSSGWDNGVFVNAGAATWGSGATGVSGAVSTSNSLVGWAANSGLSTILDDPVNGTFISPFPAEGGGRVRVGPTVPFEIVSAVDIPGDQGGWLRLTFLRSFLDHVLTPTPTITYSVWRHIPGTVPSRAGVAKGRLLGALPASRLAEMASAFPPGTWELVANVPALQLEQYVVAVPTVSNAEANEFVITAQSSTPSVWFLSNTISAQSVDNLAPAQPTGLMAAYIGGQTDLLWNANAEPDLGHYNLYRGTSADFVPSPANRIASPGLNRYIDVGPPGRYYKISAVDVNGNESGFALITPGETLDAGAGGEPVAFALEGVRPNPASGRDLRVAFALRDAAPAQLELLDVTGRRILARDVGALGAGRHSVNLAEGRSVAKGIYWVRLTQGANRRTTRAAVIE